MAIWLVRAGRKGEREAFALEHNVAAVGWDDLPDISGVESREQLADLMRQSYLLRDSGLTQYPKRVCLLVQRMLETYLRRSGSMLDWSRGKPASKRLC